MAYDLAEGEQVGGEECWTKHRALRDTMVDWGRVGGGAKDGDKLSSVGEVGLEPGQCRARDTKENRQAFKEDGVGDGVEGSGEVEEDEDTDVTGICSSEEVIHDFDQGGLSTVVGSVS